MLDTVGKGQTLIADAGYDSDRLRAEIKRSKAKCCIKPMPNRKKKYRPRKAVYAQRNRVERFFNRI